MNRYIFSHTIIFCLLCFSSCHKPDYNSKDTFIPSLGYQMEQQIDNSLCDEIINFSDSGSNTERPFSIGDIIPDDLLVVSDYCYPPDSLGKSFSFTQPTNTVFMIEISASW